MEQANWNGLVTTNHDITQGLSKTSFLMISSENLRLIRTHHYTTDNGCSISELSQCAPRFCSWFPTTFLRLRFLCWCLHYDPCQRSCRKLHSDISVPADYRNHRNRLYRVICRCNSRDAVCTPNHSNDIPWILKKCYSDAKGNLL